jgi:hypothetical protein
LQTVMTGNSLGTSLKILTCVTTSKLK